MSTKITLGGSRLGAGNRMKEYIPGTGRSTHNVSRNWKSTIAPGLLVPCLKELVLPNDTYKIDIDTKIFTLPTTGPMFGSFKFQIDLFYAPFRLYNGALHNNALGIGQKMETIEFAQIQFPMMQSINKAKAGLAADWETKDFSNSSLNHYMGYPSLPVTPNVSIAGGFKGFGVHYLMYYDIFKNAYANKQEKNAYIMYAEPERTKISEAVILRGRTEVHLPINETGTGTVPVPLGSYTSQSSSLGTVPYEYKNPTIKVKGSDLDLVGIAILFQKENIKLTLVAETVAKPESVIFNSDKTECTFEIDSRKIPEELVATGKSGPEAGGTYTYYIQTEIKNITGGSTGKRTPTMKAFPLENIDRARRAILSNNEGGAVTITALTEDAVNDPMYLNYLPYAANSEYFQSEYAAKTPLVGLLCKTYQADIFNAWLNTESVENVNRQTRVMIEDGGFSMDSLIMARKMFNLRNYINISGGTTKDWRLAMWNAETTGGIESPLYIGGLSSEILFQEVIDQAGTSQALGTIGGRGINTDNKGGHVTLKVKEEGMIMGIVSITPRLDYCQGRVWFSELKNMQQLHTPRLDRIGFEDLLSIQAASWSEGYQLDDENRPERIIYGLGKVPAWIWYQTAYDEVHGEFADGGSQNFMVLTRGYEPELENVIGGGIYKIKDFTTYINPAKYNKVFADASLTAQNFWVQIKFKIETRRAMSASLIPQA